ncbi:DUF4041 domain-containing protein [Myxococcus llanfairpwllgwyngyllgogerychwyrndrobwllllantysiliogogogochensis]|uniref:DUF4041 domain-containing protein n=1 Tax=Myxococcus llanfairpwllgwyngyllgogerychwyrndrobwllllantysiliogogogochensis TaxID=2590453 RepID=A0A540X6U3_9BACT|nr:DUF4041 domain-containing protein [Myxococcus llanfairpwllgwyngyllgogerychwyrndrobwllllantysiliogogogochensis]TQF16910.1 DUF4041 domain-containing protein [Myxococcus llanfairpwllgwyngyllgogerychwyrndrobwllllantysiliogogogochensis]
MQPAVLALAISSLLLTGLLVRTALQLRAVRARFKPVLDVEAERQRVLSSLERTKAESEHMLATERNRVASELARERDLADAAIRGAKADLEQVRASTDHAIRLERTRVASELTQAREQAQTELTRAREQGRTELARAREQADAAVREVEARRNQAREEQAQLEPLIVKLRAELRPLEEETILRSYGFYKPIYNLSSSEKYEHRLDTLRERQKAMLKNKQAASCKIEWTVNGSKAEGKKQTERTLKLMLRAFNGEADACVAKVTYKNIKAMEARIQKSAEAISGLTEIQQCFISTDYVELKLEELRLAHEYEEKRQEEKEEQRRIREQMREEETAQRELERAKLEAEREAQRDEEALRKARGELERSKGAEQSKLLERIAELERRVAEDQERQRAISQAQLTRTGHVYVISNIGSFGEDIYKVGMTRRLVPQDRIDELGDASVPFEFDVHAIIRTPDAPSLEAALHRTFSHRRVNRINERKEFFRVTLDEVAKAVREHHGEFELTRIAEAAEYRKSLALAEGERHDSPTSLRPERAVA